MNYYKSNKYVLIWQLKNAENYKFTKTGKFYSLNTLRKTLEKIPVKIKLPF